MAVERVKYWHLILDLVGICVKNETENECFEAFACNIFGVNRGEFWRVSKNVFYISGPPGGAIKKQM